ncbi:hypothetical protein [Bacteroides sp. GM023]|uniref:hypothetical protein n=1 Tax=Bacteroides sp. GM023 TaxID=2723058 RepID=UPI00168ABD08|nr:hypothetical protein [Bacteroides sp. GM023]MBD3588472.1 hypothetical protein [Bacteroides sp. GM023]
MNAKLIYRYVLVGCLLFTNCTYFACENIEELPPKEQSGSSNVYKIADPVVLNATETAIIDAIKQEYNEKVTQ